MSGRPALRVGAIVGGFIVRGLSTDTAVARHRLYEAECLLCHRRDLRRRHDMARAESCRYCAASRRGFPLPNAERNPGKRGAQLGFVPSISWNGWAQRCRAVVARFPDPAGPIEMLRRIRTVAARSYRDECYPARQWLAAGEHVGIWTWNRAGRTWHPL